MKWISMIALLLIIAPGCKNKNKNYSINHSDTTYTCSMHPQVRSDNPGDCPICGMKLIPVTKNVSTTSRQEVELSNEQIELANIRYEVQTAGILNNETVLSGTINFNEKNSEVIPSRVAGRIEKLFFKNIGDYVPTGAKVFEVYSEELNTAGQEYILALQKRKALGNAVINFDQLIEAARNKLLLLGVTRAQLKEMERTGKVPGTTAFYGTAGGFITSVDVVEGAYVTSGQTIFRLANTSTVWAEAQVYTSQMAQINTKGTVTVRLPHLNNKEVLGRIEFVNPEVNPQTRINLLRVAIPNPGNQLKPGMPAYIIWKGQQTNSIHLPSDAVIRSEKMATVWLKSGHNKFRYQVVTTGMESGNQIQINSGINKGDTVVISGAYLLNSEYLLRNGGNSAMAGMKM